MKKVLAVLAMSIFILVGCEQSSSVVAPDNTNTELEKPNKPYDAPNQTVIDPPRT